jgi:hypothetical protein
LKAIINPFHCLVVSGWWLLTISDIKIFILPIKMQKLWISNSIWKDTAWVCGMTEIHGCTLNFRLYRGTVVFRMCGIEPKSIAWQFACFFYICVVNQVTKQWVVCIHEIACVTNFSPFQKSTEFIYMRPVSHCLDRMAHRVTTFKMCYCWGHVILIKEIDEQYLMRGQLLIYYQYLINQFTNFFVHF